MARPKKDNADYFTHDSDMRNDPKIRALRRKFGLTGYAVYNFILETLTDSDFFEHEWNELSIEILAGDYDMEPELLIDIINYCTTALKLFDIENNMITCKTLRKRFEGLLSKRKRDRNRVSVSENPQSIVEYSRVEESKEKKSKEEDSKEEKMTTPQIEENLIPLEKKEKSPPSSENPPIDENFVLNKDFTKAWNRLMKMPKWTKKPKESIQTALESIQKFDDEFALMLVNIAIEGDYQGLIYPNTEVDYQKWKNLRSLNNGKKTITDYWEEYRNESA
ncbi:MAG: DUF4373 domain-containing protein [Bacteroidales bacterium]|nr:DUF4373 domain-containing protein [Bacteroidales bacterium]